MIDAFMSLLRRVVFFILVAGVVFSLIGFYHERSNGIFFVVTVAVLIVERIWETFFISSSKSDHTDSRDLNFTLIVLSYFAVLYGSIAEFFLINRGLSFLTPVGFSILLISLMLRLSSIRTLGHQWTTDISVRAFISGQRELKKEGPYQYVRHPVYVGAMLEVIAITLMGQAFYTLVFVLAVSVPLYVIRARIEEGALKEIFGDEYRRYSMVVGAFAPLLNTSGDECAVRRGGK